ncbi:MAG: lipopolysaccharide biosynthesis protein [Aggregatilineales bacterium]
MLAGGNALGQGLVVLAAPLLTRLYTPDDMGLLAAYAAAINVLVVFNALRYEQAIPLADNDEQAAHILILCLAISAAMAAALAAGAVAFRHNIAAAINITEAADYIWILPLGVMATGVYQTLNYWALRRRAFVAIGRTKFSQGAGMVIAQLGLGLLQVGPAGLLLGYIVGQSSGSTVLARLVGSPRRLAASFRWSTLQQMAVRYRRFPLFSSWSGVLNSVGFNLPILLIAALYGAETAGLYLLGQRVLGTPMRLISVSVGEVFYSRAAQIKRENPAALTRFYLKTVQKLFLIGVGPIALFAIVGPPLFGWVFGREWQAAGHIMQVIAPMLLAEFTVSPVSRIVFVIERQDAQLVWDAFIAAAVLIVFGLASALALEPIVTIGLYSASAVLAQVAAFVMYWALLRGKPHGASN